MRANHLLQGPHQALLLFKLFLLLLEHLLVLPLHLLEGGRVASLICRLQDMAALASCQRTGLLLSRRAYPRSRAVLCIHHPSISGLLLDGTSARPGMRLTRVLLPPRACTRQLRFLISVDAIEWPHSSLGPRSSVCLPEDIVIGGAE